MAHADIARFQIPYFHEKVVPFPAGGVHDVSLRMFFCAVGELRILDFLFVRMCRAMERYGGVAARQETSVGINDDLVEPKDESVFCKSVGCEDDAHNRLGGCFALVIEVPAGTETQECYQKNPDESPEGAAVLRFRFRNGGCEFG